MAPAGVSIHAARVPLGVYTPGGQMAPTIALAPVRAFAEGPQIDDAAELLAAARLHGIAVAFTSSSYVQGAAVDLAGHGSRRRWARGRVVGMVCGAAPGPASLARSRGWIPWARLS
jgi:maleate isomerase